MQIEVKTGVQTSH